MSRPELTSFSYSILALVGSGGAGPHDLVRMAKQGRIYSAGADSQYYAEPKRLERLGYLESRKEPGRTRERTHYELTDKAYDALAEWARTPVQFPKFSNEAITRVLAADLVGEGAVLEGLRAMRADIADHFARLDVAEAVAETLPHRRKYLRLNHRLARRLLQAHVDWLDELERELGSRGARRARQDGARPPRSRGPRGA